MLKEKKNRNLQVHIRIDKAINNRFKKTQGMVRSKMDETIIIAFS